MRMPATAQGRLTRFWLLLLALVMPFAGAQAGCQVNNFAPAGILLGSTERLISQMEVATGTNVQGAAGGLSVRFEVLSGSADLNGQRNATTNTVPLTSGTLGTGVDVRPLSAGTLVLQVTWLSGTAPVSCDGSPAGNNAERISITVQEQLGALTLRALSGSGQSVPESTDGAALVVEVKDAGGMPVSGQVVQFAALPTAGLALSASSATSDGSGRAQVGVRGLREGAAQVVASLASSPATRVQFNLTITHDPRLAQLSALTSTSQLVTVNDFSAPLVVQYRSARDSLVIGAPVLWRVEPADAGVLECPGNCATSIQSTSGNRFKPARAGSFVVIASLPEAPQTQVRFNLVAGGVPAGSTLALISGNNQQLVPGAPSAPLVVELKNAQGQVLPGVAIRFTGDPSGAVNFLPGAVVQTDAAGRATVQAAPQLPVPINITATVLSDPGISIRFSLTGGTRFLGGLSGNQQRIAGLIDTVCPQLAGMPPAMLGVDPADLLARCSELVGAINGRPDDAREALNQLLPDEAAPQATASLNVRDSQLRNLDLRLETLRAGGRAASGLNLSGLSLQTGSGTLPVSLLADLVNQLGGGANDEDETAGGFISPWGVFVTGTVGRVDRDTTPGNPGFNANTFSLTGGLDYRFNYNLVAGAAIGYDTNDIDVVSGNGDVNVRSLTLSLYSSYNTDTDFYLDGRLALGMLDFELERRIRFQLGPNPVDVAARAAPEGDSRLLAISAGKNYAWNAWSFGGYLRGEVSRIDLDGYTESIRNPSGAGRGLAVQVDDRTLDSRTATVGLRFSVASSQGWGVLLPYGRVEWVREFEDDAQVISTRFVNDPGRNTIAIVTDTQDEGYGNAALGFSGVFSNGRSAFLQYERRFAQDAIERSTLTLGGRFEF